MSIEGFRRMTTGKSIINYSFIVAVKVIPLEVIGTDNTQLDLLRREIQIM